MLRSQDPAKPQRQQRCAVVRTGVITMKGLMSTTSWPSHPSSAKRLSKMLWRLNYSCSHAMLCLQPAVLCCCRVTSWFSTVCAPQPRNLLVDHAAGCHAADRCFAIPLVSILTVIKPNQHGPVSSTRTTDQTSGSGRDDLRRDDHHVQTNPP